MTDHRHMTDHHTCSMHRLTHRRFDYPSESCVSAELPSVVSNTAILTTASLQNQKITEKEHQIEHRRQASKNLGGLGAGPQLLCQGIRHCSITPFTKNEFKIAQFCICYLIQFKTVADPFSKPSLNKSSFSAISNVDLAVFAVGLAGEAFEPGGTA